MNPALDNLLCLDFEASAFGKGSYPIEAAVASPLTGEAHEWLIRPTETWLSNGLWAADSAAVHGISREELVRNGACVAEVARTLAARCAGKRVLSDAVEYDGAWLATLYAAAGMTAPPFVLSDFHAFAWQLAVRRGRRPDIAYAKADLEAQMRFPMSHRAGADARSRAEMMRLIIG